MLIWDFSKGFHIEICKIKLSEKFSDYNINIFWDFTTSHNIF